MTIRKKHDNDVYKSLKSDYLNKLADVLSLEFLKLTKRVYKYITSNRIYNMIGQLFN